METQEYKAEEISKYKKWKWAIQDIAGLKIHGFIAWASKDPEVKQLHQEMEKAIYQEGDQPKALRIGEEIKSRILMNTHERAEKLHL